MSYSAKELSDYGGQPIECYEFVGSYKNYRYTSCDRTVLVAGQLFFPAPISRSQISAGTSGEDNLDVELEMPNDLELIVDYGFQITPPDLFLTIYRVHDGDDFNTDYIIYWTGNVGGIVFEQELSKVRIPSVFGQALASNIPSVYYATMCNHVLFDGGCKISRAANSITTTVLAVAGTSVTIASAGSFPDGFFKGGEVADIAHNNRRMILAHAANQLTVNYPFSLLTPGTTIEVTGGCNHAYDGDCKNKFNNKINYGGYPFIPSVNPFTEGLE